MKNGARQSGFGAVSDRMRRYRVLARERPAVRPRMFARRDIAAGSLSVDVIWGEGVGRPFCAGGGGGREGEGRGPRGRVR